VNRELAALEDPDSDDSHALLCKQLSTKLKAGTLKGRRSIYKRSR
jgi:hypothetical protein